MAKKNLSYLLGTSVLIVVLLYVADQILSLSYLSKVLLKIILFSVFPIFYTLKTGNNVFKTSWENFLRPKEKTSRKNINLIPGVSVFALIIPAYILAKPYIDTVQLLWEFEHKYKITQSNIIYYGLYLFFINSLLEEFFCRGFIFLNIKKQA